MAANPSTQLPDPPGPASAAIDSARLGPALLVAASLIAAIRTSTWSQERLRSPANPEWEAELDQSIAMAHRIFAHLDQKSPFLFRRLD